VLVAAGLVAKKADELGLKPKPWVKTSLAPGSQVVTDYLVKAGLQEHLDNIGFNLVGYGCTTCIGNSGPLAEPISKAINDNGLVAAAVISGNRNFEGRVSPDVRANFLASPPLVVAYALKGTVIEDFTPPRSARARTGQDVYLKDIWPTNEEVFSTDGGLHGSRDVPGALCRRLQGRCALAGDQRHRGRKPISGARAAPMSPTRPISKGMSMTRRRFRTSSAPSRSPSSAIRSPPITSARRQHQGGQPGRQMADGASGRQGGLQQLRRAPRPS
jgi:hypothetical protein